jgi:hypothetical protein
VLGGGFGDLKPACKHVGTELVIYLLIFAIWAINSAATDAHDKFCSGFVDSPAKWAVNTFFFYPIDVSDPAGFAIYKAPLILVGKGNCF